MENAKNKLKTAKDKLSTIINAIDFHDLELIIEDILAIQEQLEMSIQELDEVIAISQN